MIDSFKLWRVKAGFNSVRSSFYLDLASALDSKAPLTDLIAQYSKMSAGPISAMMALWVRGLSKSPDSLARATREYVDASDSVVIAAAEKSKDPGELYRTYAQNLRLRQQMVRGVTMPLIIPAVSLVLLLAIMAFFHFSVYANMVKNVPIKFWPDYSAFSYHLLQAIFSRWGAIALVTGIALLIWFLWSIKNLTGALRNVLDRRMFPYTVIAQMEILSAFNVLASLIAAGEADVRALGLIILNASPWLEWRLGSVRRETRFGRTVLESLRDLPIAQMLSARLFVMSKHAKQEALPQIVLGASRHESLMLSERMDATSKIITALVVLFLVAMVGMLMLGIVGFTDASQNMIAAAKRHH